ncbi:hypothetical protein EA772_14240 [Pedobacter sp. G11]|uniref:peptidoglycan-binding domain-containing protein n=1 Tax=Pedobacter sp. G11 TaxID=2482728 RepID=UPI000F5E06B2|nr:peptidoglycan-binding domain-containing protein [Pedobacter sp. G11]AZI26438.1 hypothetical protein EA772_14240 [Pedobacter sp. G11]
MSTLTINKDLINTTLEYNSFVIPKDAKLLICGIRGAVLQVPNDNDFKASQTLLLSDLNYKNPRCTILLYNLQNAEIAAYPASTVPHIKNISASILKKGMGTNCLMTGFYRDYRKGVHKPQSPTGHAALRQTAPHPIRRSTDDEDYDNDDRIEYVNPFDNIHSGWFQSIDSESYASAGCQVIMGYPACTLPGREKGVGPWAKFQSNIYKSSQQSFAYLLVSARELIQISTNKDPKRRKLKFGSQGDIVKELQEKLAKLHYYEGKPDGDFGERTLKAVLSFQQGVFGKEGADGVVGDLTWEQLS